MIWVQVDRVQGYDEDQIALVILDLSNFVAQIPVILGTPIISQVVNIKKEAEMDALAMPWVNARVAHLLLVHRMIPMKVDGQKEEVDANSYDQLMHTQSANLTLQLHILLQLYAYIIIQLHIIHQRPRIMIVYHMISEVIQNNLVCIVRFHGVDIPIVFQWGHQ